MMDVPTFASLGGLMIGLLALVGGVLYRLGRHSSRFDHLDQQIAGIREEFHREMGEAREEFRREMGETREEFRREMRETREEFRRELGETRDENRRNHQQLLQALAHHTHDQDTGFTIFRIPPGTENPAS